MECSPPHPFEHLPVGYNELKIVFEIDNKIYSGKIVDIDIDDCGTKRYKLIPWNSKTFDIGDRENDHIFIHYTYIKVIKYRCITEEEGNMFSVGNKVKVKNRTITTGVIKEINHNKAKITNDNLGTNYIIVPIWDIYPINRPEDIFIDDFIINKNDISVGIDHENIYKVSNIKKDRYEVYNTYGNVANDISFEDAVYYFKKDEPVEVKGKSGVVHTIIDSIGDIKVRILNYYHYFNYQDVTRVMDNDTKKIMELFNKIKSSIFQIEQLDLYNPLELDMFEDNFRILRNDFDEAESLLNSIADANIFAIDNPVEYRKTAIAQLKNTIYNIALRKLNINYNGDSETIIIELIYKKLNEKKVSELLAT